MAAITPPHRHSTPAARCDRQAKYIAALSRRNWLESRRCITRRRYSEGTAYTLPALISTELLRQLDCAASAPLRAESIHREILPVRTMYLSWSPCRCSPSGISLAPDAMPQLSLIHI